MLYRLGSGSTFLPALATALAVLGAELAHAADPAPEVVRLGYVQPERGAADPQQRPSLIPWHLRG